MAIYLVRHAVAVGRHGWDGADELRPLTPKGERQAEALARPASSGTEVRRILSSPARAVPRHRRPRSADASASRSSTPTSWPRGPTPSKAVDLLSELAAKKGDSVLCTHGDLIPEVLRRLARRRHAALESDLQFAKGSTWELAVDRRRRIVSGRYHPPAE